MEQNIGFSSVFINSTQIPAPATLRGLTCVTTCHLYLVYSYIIPVFNELLNHIEHEDKQTLGQNILVLEQRLTDTEWHASKQMSLLFSMDTVRAHWRL